MPNIFPNVRGVFMQLGATSRHETTDAHPKTAVKTMATPARFERATGRLEGGAVNENARTGNALRAACVSAATVAPKIGGAP